MIDSLGRSDILDLARCGGTCVSIYVRMGSVINGAIALERATQRAIRMLPDSESNQADAMIQFAGALSEKIADTGAKSWLAILAGSNGCRAYALPGRCRELVVVGSVFHLRPLWRHCTEPIHVMDKFFERRSEGRVEARIGPLIGLAAEGRVETLVADATFIQWGWVDSQLRVRVSSRQSKGAEDLVNRALIETLKHGGEAYEVEEVPEIATLGAVGLLRP